MSVVYLQGQPLSDPLWQHRRMGQRSSGMNEEFANLTEGLNPNQRRLLASIYAELQTN